MKSHICRLHQDLKQVASTADQAHIMTLMLNDCLCMHCELLDSLDSELALVVCLKVKSYINVCSIILLIMIFLWTVLELELDNVVHCVEFSHKTSVLYLHEAYYYVENDNFLILSTFSCIMPTRQWLC